MRPRGEAVRDLRGFSSSGSSCLAFGPCASRRDGNETVLPAGVIETVDHDDEKVFVNRTKEQIKDAPEFERTSKLTLDDEYRDLLGSYYGPGGVGYRDWDDR